jgi:hypothetical protein
VVRLLAYLRQNLSPEKFGVLRDRVVRLDKQRRELRAAGRDEARLPRVLVVNHRCTAYCVRQLICGGFDSTDAAEFARFVRSSGETPIPLPQPRF